jgi:hypothetical protein
MLRFGPCPESIMKTLPSGRSLLRVSRGILLRALAETFIWFSCRLCRLLTIAGGVAMLMSSSRETGTLLRLGRLLTAVASTMAGSSSVVPALAKVIPENVSGVIDYAQLCIINNARDILRDHFRTGGHRESGNCECKHAPEKAPQAEAEAEPSTRSKNHGASSATSSFQSTNSANQTNNSYRSSSCNDASDRFDQAFASGHSFHNAFGRRQLEPDGLRWRVSLLCACFFLLLLATTFVSDTFAMTSDFVRNGFKVEQNNHGACVVTQGKFELPAVSKLRKNDRCTDAQWYHNNFALRTPHNFESSSRDLRTEIDAERYQKAIEFSQKRLAELALTLADPTIGMRDRQFAVSSQTTQLKFLQENQDNLKYVQKQPGLDWLPVTTRSP